MFVDSVRWLVPLVPRAQCSRVYSLSLHLVIRSSCGSIWLRVRDSVLSDGFRGCRVGLDRMVFT